MKHALDINLDDPHECQEFIDAYGTLKGRALANRLGLKGKGSSKLATRLSGFAWNKITAIRQRLNGDIQCAQVYERICDRIYREDIAPNLDAW
jgi:RNA binding exosome subunit